MRLRFWKREDETEDSAKASALAHAEDVARRLDQIEAKVERLSARVRAHMQNHDYESQLVR